MRPRQTVGKCGSDQEAHDRVFTEDDPVLPEQSAELAKERGGHSGARI